MKRFFPCVHGTFPQTMPQSSHFEIGDAPKLGVRHTQCFLLFWCIALAFVFRANLSIAIVAMTDRSSTNPNFEEYDWSEQVKSILLGSFFWGITLTQILGGYLSRRFGGRISLLCSFLICSTMSLVTPFATHIGNWPLLCVVRAIQGLTNGIIFPSVHMVLANWSPKEERVVLCTIAYSGFEFGIVVIFGVSGFIASSTLGWPGIFYISGGLGIIWSLFWYFYGASSPREHKLISIAERNMIEYSITDGDTKTQVDQSTIGKLKIPWFKFITSQHFWALLVTHCAFYSCSWIILTQIPTYLKNILGFEIESNAMLSSFLHLVTLLMNFVFLPLAALIQKRKWLTLTQSRKMFNTIAHWIPGAALIWLGYVDSSQSILAMVLLVIAVSLGAAIYFGYMVNHIDLSPNFAGIIMSISSTVANAMSILTSFIVGVVVKDEKNPYDWRIVFFISAGLFFFGNLVFIICGTAEEQPWNKPELSVGTELKPLKSKNNET